MRGCAYLGSSRRQSRANAGGHQGVGTSSFVVVSAEKESGQSVFVVIFKCETSVQAAVGVIAYERKLVATADLGISCDDNFTVALRRHIVAEGATLSSDGGVAEGKETCACLEGEEPRGTFHFTGPISMRENKRCQAPQATESKASAFFGSNR